MIRDHSFLILKFWYIQIKLKCTTTIQRACWSKDETCHSRYSSSKGLGNWKEKKKNRIQMTFKKKNCLVFQSVLSSKNPVWMNNNSVVLLSLPFSSEMVIVHYTLVSNQRHKVIVLSCILRHVFSTGMHFVIPLISGVLRNSPEMNTGKP